MLQHGWNKCIKRDHWLPSWPERSCWRCCFEFFRPWKRDASWRNLLESAVFTKNTTFSCLLQVHSQRSTLFQIEVQKHQPGRSNQNNKRDGCIHAICLWHFWWVLFKSYKAVALYCPRNVFEAQQLKSVLPVTYINQGICCYSARKQLLNRFSFPKKTGCLNQGRFCLITKLISLKLY